MKLAEAFVEVRAVPSGSFESDIAKVGQRAGQKAGQGLEKEAAEGGKRAGQKAGKGLEDGIGKGAKSAAKGLASVFAGIAVGAFFKNAIDQASRLEQAVGATEAIFKESAGTIEDFAKTSADAFGISNAAARELTSQIGGLLKGFGFTEKAAADTSVQIAKLGADLSATFGGKPEEAVQALGAALRGETDPLERFGISLNQTQVNLKAVELGLASSTSAVDPNAKAQATLALIYERSADAQGQFAREADTAAGAQARAAAKAEEASARLGQNLLPIYTAIMTTVGQLAEVFGALPGPVQVGVVALAGIAALAGPIGKTVETIKSLGSAVLAANPAWLALGGAVFAAIAIYKAVQDQKEKLIQTTKDLEAALRGEGDAFDVSALDDFVGSKFEKFAGQLKGAGISYKQLTDIILTGKRPIGEAGEAFQALVDDVDGFNATRNETRFALGELVKGTLDSAKAAGELTAAEEQLVESLIRTQGAAAGLTEQQLDENIERWRDGALSGQEAFSDLGAALELINQVAPPAAEGVDKTAASAKSAAQPVQRITTLQNDLAGAFELGADMADAFAKAVESVLSPALDAQAAYDAYTESVLAVTASLAENGKTLDGTTEKGLANRDALRSMAEAGLKSAQAMVTNGASQEEAAVAIQGVRDNLIAQAKTFGLTQEQAEEYADQLGLTPKNITTTIELAKLEAEKVRLSGWLTQLQGVPDDVVTSIQAQIDAGDIAGAEARLNNLARNRTATINIITREGTISTRGNVALRERGGYTPWSGPIRRAERSSFLGVPMLRTGEGGPENITDPFVLTAAITRKIDELASMERAPAAGGTDTIIVPVSIDGREITRVVARHNRLERGSRRY